KRALIELDRFLAASIKIEIGLNLHAMLLCEGELGTKHQGGQTVSPSKARFNVAMSKFFICRKAFITRADFLASGSIICKNPTGPLARRARICPLAIRKDAPGRPR